eukprot:1674516-Prymnesium_polylepis.1
MPASRRSGRRRVLDDESGADDRAARRQSARWSHLSGPVSLFMHSSHSDGRAPNSAVWRFHGLGRLGAIQHIRYSHLVPLWAVLKYISPETSPNFARPRIATYPARGT